jgi:hypothetical protein
MITQKQWYSIIRALTIALDVYKVKGAEKALRWAMGKVRH